MNIWKWSKESERAAQLIAEGKVSDEQIARELGIARRTLYYWQAEPEFKARVHEYHEGWRLGFEAEGLSRKQNRQDEYNRLYAEWRGLVSARASDQTRAHIPGYRTGWLVERSKTTKEGIVEEYEFDAPLASTLLGLLKQAAQEADQWNDGKRTIEHQGQVSSTVDLSKLSDEELSHLDQIINRATDSGSRPDSGDDPAGAGPAQP